MILTNFPKTTTGNDKGMVQGNESALASEAIAENGIVGAPDELCPVTVDDRSPCLDERVLDGIQEGRVWVEIRKSNGFQLEALAGKVRVDELFDCAFCGASSIYDSEIREDLTRRFVCRFINKSF